MSYLHNKSGTLRSPDVGLVVRNHVVWVYAVAHADEHGIGHHEFMDSRHGHNHATRHVVSSLERCQAVTGWCFTAMHDTTSTEVSGNRPQDGASSLLRLRSV